MKHRYGHIKDVRDKRDLVHPGKALLARLPSKVDLRLKMAPVFDQGDLGSCTANALVGLREYMAGITVIESELSRLFLYWQERYLEGTVGSDSGAQIRDGMKALASIGVCPEADDPYDVSAFTATPSPKATFDAASFRISVYQRIASLGAAKAALAARDPVVFGFDVYESFESDKVANTGIMPMPKKREEFLGGHAVLAVGYDDSKNWLIVRNSWGSGWGDKGYFYMPYAVFTKYFSDAWMATA